MQAIAVGGEATHRRRVGMAPGRVGRMITPTRADVVAVVVRDAIVRQNIIVRLSLGNGVAPREAFPAEAAPCRLFPLRLRRHPVAVGGPVHRRLDGAGPHDRTAHRVAGREPFHLAPGVAPFAHIPPGHGLHRVTGSLASANRQIRVAVIYRPHSDRVPFRLGHFLLTHVKGTQGHCPGRSISGSIQ